LGRRSNTLGVDLGSKLAVLSREINTLQDQRSRANGNLEAVTKQKAELEDQIRALGYEPTELDKIIELKDSTLSSMMQTIETALRGVEANRDEVLNSKSNQA